MKNANKMKIFRAVNKQQPVCGFIAQSMKFVCTVFH